MNIKDAKMVYCPGKVEAAAVRVHNGSTWIDVWTNIKIMTLLSNGITGGFSNLATDKRSLALYQYQDGTEGSVAKGGTVIVYLEGLWTNPTITFDWRGGFTYATASGTFNSTPSGSISIYHRVSGSSSAGTTIAISDVGKIVSGGVETTYGSYSKTLNGTYDRIGLSIYLSSFSGTFYNAFMELNVSNFNIGTQKVGFPDALIYDY